MREICSIKNVSQLSRMGFHVLVCVCEARCGSLYVCNLLLLFVVCLFVCLCLWGEVQEFVCMQFVVVCLLFVCLWWVYARFVCMQFVVVVCCLFVCVCVCEARCRSLYVCNLLLFVCLCLWVCEEFMQGLYVCNLLLLLLFVRLFVFVSLWRLYARFVCMQFVVCLCLLVCEDCMQGLYVSNLLLPLLVMLFVNLFVFENIETCMSPFCMSFMNMYVLLEVHNGLIAWYKIQALFCFVCGAFFSA